MLLFHGLAAYRGTRCPLQQLRAAAACLDRQISVADRPIGPIGIIVSGDILAGYEEDCLSQVIDGTRYAKGDHPGNVHPCHATMAGVSLDSPEEVEGWLRSLCQRRHHSYAELFMHCRAITHVWHKPYVGQQTRKVARIIARRHGARVVEVQRYTRPWEVYRPYVTPDIYWGHLHDLHDLHDMMEG